MVSFTRKPSAKVWNRRVTWGLDAIAKDSTFYLDEKKVRIEPIDHTKTLGFM